MKKFINEVWTVQLPDKDVHISATVPKTDIEVFVKGKGEWGQNALFLKNTKTLTIFNDTSEAQNYVNYVSKWDRNFRDILNETDTDSGFNSIVHFVNMYKNGLVVPSGNICIPVELSNEKAIELAKEFNPTYDNLTEAEQTQEVNDAINSYNTMIALFNSQ